MDLVRLLKENEEKIEKAYKAGLEDGYKKGVAESKAKISIADLIGDWTDISDLIKAGFYDNADLIEDIVRKLVEEDGVEQTKKNALEFVTSYSEMLLDALIDMIEGNYEI